MRSLIALATAVLLLAPAVAQPGRATQENPNQPRRVTSREGTPLRELCRNKETQLIVEKNADPPLMVAPYPKEISPIEWLASHADVVLIVSVSRVKSSLTEPADWITSTVSARIVQVLKPSAASARFRAGETLRFEQDGGDVRIGDTIVHAVLPWTSEFRPGGKYLVFWKLYDGRIAVGPETSFEVDRSNTLVPPRDRRFRAA